MGWRTKLCGLLFIGICSVALAEPQLAVLCPAAWRPAMASWVEHRRGQGCRVEFHETLQQARFSNPSEACLLIVGDGRSAGLPPVSVPAYVISRYGPEKQISTDLPYAQSLGLNAVARMPFRSKEDLRRYLTRVMQHERRSESNGAMQLRLAAGEGGFSPMIDLAIEASARRLVTDLAPRDAEVSLRKYPAPVVGRETTTHAKKQESVWVWLGHGLRQDLPGLTREELHRSTKHTEVAVLLACYAGDFATREECVAQQLLNSEGGPLAVIASTRVSMPYANARLGGELLLAMSTGQEKSVGRLFAEARQQLTAEETDPRLTPLDSLAELFGASPKLLTQERIEHAWMYHLLGDPMVRIRSRGTQRLATRESEVTR